MSTITISPWTQTKPARVVVRPRRSSAPRAVRSSAGRTTDGVPTRVRLTRRGRITVLAGFLLILGALTVAFGPVATGTLHAGTPEPVRIVVVHPGDTLYDIAGTVAEPGRVNDMVAHIEQLNALSSPVIQPGQKIAIPVGSK